MLPPLSERDQMIAYRLSKLGFYYFPGLGRKPPKPEATQLVIHQWYFATGIAGVWAYRNGYIFLSGKVSVTEPLKLQIFEVFKSLNEEADRQAA